MLNSSVTSFDARVAQGVTFLHEHYGKDWHKGVDTHSRYWF